jgi:very-short-patch-repair endonuclease
MDHFTNSQNKRQAYVFTIHRNGDGVALRCCMSWLTSKLLEVPGDIEFSILLVGGNQKTVRVDYQRHRTGASIKEIQSLISESGLIIEVDAIQNKPKFDDLMTLTESEIERAYLRAAYPKFDFIQPQLVIGAYRVDFAIPDYRVAIELDGHEFHSSKEQRTKDAKRERDLEMMGWRVIRFTGTEIHHNVDACVDETLRLIASFGGEK